MEDKKFKIVYCTPSLYIAGGVERVLTMKVNYFAEHFGYDITIILTDGKGKSFAFPLSDKVKVVNLDINFEELWNQSFLRKVVLYLKKQREYKRKLTKELMSIRPDITDSLLRREINFITKISDGSKKIGELHSNRLSFRSFRNDNPNILKKIFSQLWMRSLLRNLNRLDRFVVLTNEDKLAWKELTNVETIFNPISFSISRTSTLTSKRIIAVGRYSYEKGIDLLLKAWKLVERQSFDWELVVYGTGDRTIYEQLMKQLNIDLYRCHLNGVISDIQKEYINSSVFVCSSREEGLSMAMLEAVSCGLPIVSFACPCGPRDVITDGVDGLLVENGNVNALASSLVNLINNPEILHRMGRSILQKASKFQIDHLAQEWKYLFENL